MLPPVILLGSALRPPRTLGPSALLRLAESAGCAEVAVDGGCLLSHLPAFPAAGVPIVAVVAPLVDEPPETGKRLPHLAALDDPEERRAAVALTRVTIEKAREVGVLLVGLPFGRISLAVREPQIRLFFERRELDDGEPGAPWLRRALAERREKSQRVIDACRAALEPLLRVAEPLGVTLSLICAASPWGAPSPREALALLADYRGAPIGVTLSPARDAALAALGLALGPERRQALREAARLVHATDAVGLNHRLLPGMGEADLSPLAGTESLPVVLSGPSDVTDEEVARAKELIAATTRAPSTGG